MPAVKRLVISGLAVLAIATGAATPVAHADPFGVPGMGCETVRWGFLGLTQKRSICDSPRYADGHWDRTRIIWSPAHYVAASSYCGTYSCTYSEGYNVDTQIYGKETYPVNDDDVLPDEPGWLPTGTANIK
jgi:hypothetical protein